ncbi:1,4-dihydroxy-2-naphthoate polyprenyltransferase [Aeromicrobium duanguangcaii]|uniref:1,4-dihydroxy-2-naphthoate octaprenyltransferase n=1 Tax=Aeromicrobium duanguangcaii TaxID=2968086 RepID=A0ABY5KKQ2_9ACTN|nr:1,4-dihydroxy-2-naphthoate polyprenyltransferase [Aeromicrobium duanguangcaii]MCD9154019.1 1,4-dihydroxy-2-naphthoate polyprenyltransferase [Aeromicrobium duanguangcaii]UUI68903.1 1,4-dihydroxy-2-naphthoate polyprenyltransferase [Aeromicrobium duanguangcaii]
MSTPTGLNLWIEGARLRTLPAAVAPVAVGTGAAAFDDGAIWWKALLALGVSLALQIGVNYANDYSDGIKGTDENRVGPLRLVGSGLVAPAKVKAAALGFLALGGALGLVLAATSGWWLIAVGVLAILAAWGYTGGKNPYGYRALGEVSVFLFFGIVAVLGTTYVQLGSVNAVSVAGALGVGALACAILVANNLRDIPTDTETGKRTLAVVMGDARTRLFYVALMLLAFVVVVAWVVTETPWALLALVGLPPALRATAVVRGGGSGPALIPVLKDTGIAELLYAIGLTVALVIGPWW